jgi:hypothetical protein
MSAVRRLDLRALGLVALLCLGLALAAPERARAYHDKETPSLDDSAYQLRSGEWLLGPLELGVGFWRFQISTRTMPWILGAALGKLMPNLNAELFVFELGGVTLNADAGVYYVNSNKLVEGDELLHLFIIPASVSASWRINERHTLSGRFRYVRVTSDGSADSGDYEVNAITLADNAQIQANWEWRLNRVCALHTTLRYLPFQGDPVIQSTVPIDDRTTAKVDATVDTENLQHSVAGLVAGVFSWKHFNLRAGVGYGAVFLQGPGLVLPLKYPYPDLSLYWRL